MGNLAGAFPLGVDELPLVNEVGALVLEHRVDVRQVQPPHRRDRAFLQVTTAVHVQAVVQ